MKKSTVLILLFLLIGCITALPLYAETKVTAKGVVKARGNGVVSMSGTGDVEVSGEGLVKVNANASVEIVEGSGEKIITEDGGMLFINFSGKAKITGKDIMVELEGANIYVRVQGQGALTLKGIGYYIMGFTIGYWNPMDKIIIIFIPGENS